MTLFPLSRALSCEDVAPYTRWRAGSRRLDRDPKDVLLMAKGKRTFQPNNRRRARVHGFRHRMRTRAGRSILGARRRKGRTRLAV